MTDCNKCLWATRDGGCASWNCEFIPMKEAAEAWKVEQTQKELMQKALDPEWQRAHRAMGFSSPIADLYDTLEELARERSEKGADDETD